MYEFIRSQEKHYAVSLLCKTLQVSRSAYYAYRKGQSYSEKPHEKATETAIVTAFTSHRRRYGVRRLLPELRQQGIQIGHYRVRKALRRYGLKAIQPRSYVPRTTDSRHPYPISPNLLAELPLPVQPEQVLVGDITYIPLWGGNWAYLSVWMDLYSRKVVGWSLAEHMREELVISSFEKVLNNCSLSARTIIHSDRGGQYASKKFRRLLEKHQIKQSMSRADNPYDNAFMESYFSRLKAELLENGAFETIEDARTELFEYIEIYYNRKRRHSALGYVSPVDFEQQQSKLST